MGSESLATTKFNSETAKFDSIPFQTEEDIKEKFLDQAKREDPNSTYEVELVLNLRGDKFDRLKQFSTEEEFNKLIENVNDEDKSYLVFIRKITK